ncbi:MAG: radical SAM protein [Planctomycetota bacterium]|jgi:MoaA/NifB/PqqE/SkfB family radical SAM enzyme
MRTLLNYIRNYASLAVGREPGKPLLFSYYVTHRCELNCAYCSDGDGKRFKEERVPELLSGEAKRLISVLRGSADVLDITGGEPMLRNDLEEILAHAKSEGLRTILNTKGIGLEKRPELVELSDILVLSLDTLDANRLSRLLGRPLEAAESVLSALHFAMEKCHVNGSKLVIGAVATPDNLDDVSAVRRFAADNNIRFHLSPEIVGTAANPALRGNVNYERLVEDVLRAKMKRNGVLGVKEYLRGIKRFSGFSCHPLLMPVIRPDGRLYYPCLESKHAEISILEAGGYEAALKEARNRYGGIPRCRNCCHIFCHMALSLLQQHPLSALLELKHWGN